MAGTCVESREYGILDTYQSDVMMVKMVNTADAADGSFPDTTISNVGGYIVGVYVKPDGTATPTDNFDLTLKMDGVDILGGQGENLSNAANSHITPVNTASDVVYAPFVGPVVQSITGNSMNSAVVTIYYMVSK